MARRPEAGFKITTGGAWHYFSVQRARIDINGDGIILDGMEGRKIFISGAAYSRLTRARNRRYSKEEAARKGIEKP